MNEAHGDGINVATDMPRILRDFATACRRHQVKVGEDFDTFAAKYFADLAHCDLHPKGTAPAAAVVHVPQHVPLPTTESMPPTVAPANPYAKEDTPEPAAEAGAAVQPAETPAEPAAESPAAAEAPQQEQQAVGGPSEDAAATKIQALHKGRATRKKQATEGSAPLTQQLRDQKQRFLPGPRKVHLPEVEEATHVVSIFDADAEGDGFKVVFAVRVVATQQLLAAELTVQTLPTVIPSTCTVHAFWKACATNEPTGFALLEKDVPSTALLVTVKTGRTTTEQAEIPLCDMGSDPELGRQYFDTPYM